MRSLQTAINNTNPGPTLGMFIRGVRMGFYYVHAIQGFVRISGGLDTGDGPPWKFEFHPEGLIPNNLKPAHGTFKKWWPSSDDPYGERALPVLESPYVAAIKKVKRYFVA